MRHKLLFCIKHSFLLLWLWPIISVCSGLFHLFACFKGRSYSNISCKWADVKWRHVEKCLHVNMCLWDIKWGDAERLLTEAEVSLCSLSFSKAWQNALQRFIHTVSTAVKLVLIFASDCGWGSKHKHNAQNVKGKMAQKMASLPTHQRT